MIASSNSIVIRLVSIFLLVTLCLSPAGVAFAHIGIETSPTTSCDAIDSNDLATHVTNQMESRLAQTSTDLGLQTKLYTSRPTVASTSVWTRNPDVWTQKDVPLDFTGVSGWNDQTGGTYQKGAVLITPRHFITADHFAPTVGARFYFFDSAGNPVERTVVDIETVVNTDITVGVLDSDVPDSIAYYPIMASSTIEGLLQSVIPQTLDVPIVIFDQEGKALVQSLTNLNLSYFENQVNMYTPYTTGNKVPFSEELITGDSGQARFMIIDNKPVLLGSTYSTTWSDNASYYVSRINTAIDSLGSNGYEVTIFDPECFTNYRPNHAPDIAEASWADLSLDESISFTTPIRTFLINDGPDTGQAYTFTLTSLTGYNDDSIVLPVNDYFYFAPGTADLYQKKHINTSVYGSEFKLKLFATDNGTPARSSFYNAEIHLTRNSFRSNVSVDTRYATTTDRDGGSASLYPVAFFDSQDRLVVSGPFVSIGQNVARSIARFSPTGVFDSSYLPSAAFPTTTIPSIYLQDSDGNYIFSGTFLNFNGGSDTRRYFKVYSDNPVLDSTFMTNIGTTSSGVTTRAKKFGNKLIVYGFMTVFNGVSVPKTYMMNNDGTLDTAFLTAIGTGITGLTLSNKGLIVDGNNIIYGGSFSGFNGTSVLGFAKINGLTGAVDTTFNTNIGTGLDTALVNAQRITEAVLTADGKYLFSGNFTSFNGVTSNGLVLLNSDGTIDANFSANVGAGFNGLPSSLAAQPDGKILVGGAFTEFNSENVGHLVRLNADGTLDETFHNNIGSGLNGSSFGIMNLANDGRLVVTGRFTDFNGEIVDSLAVLRTDVPDAPSISAPTTVEPGFPVVISGAAVASSTVYVYDQGVLLGQTTTDNNGNWNYSYTPSAHGTHTYQALQTVKILDTATSSLSLAATTLIQQNASVTQSSTGGGSSGGGGGAINIIYDNSQTPHTITPIDTARPMPNLNTPTLPIKFQLFIKDLTVGAQSSAVLELQKFLNLKGFTVSTSGAGAKGKETNYFGAKTKNALAKFQRSVGIKPAVGYFGPITRKYILSH